MENRIAGKVIVVTGAGSGIGKATAELLAGLGAKVVLGARRTENIRMVADTINHSGGQAAFLATDIIQKEDLNALVGFAIKQFGRLDVMINNAGIAQLQRMEEVDISGWEQMIDVNIKGTLYGIAAAMPEFLKNGSGHFINILSTAGIAIVPAMGVYAGTKNAVRTINEALRQESEGRWRVTGISPGFVASEFVSNIKNEAIRSASQATADKIAIPAKAIAEAVAYAIGQPDIVDVGDIVVRPTVQG
ncbi:SDR family oxidoreductase [Mucilaginibacter pallidiroseus]|uniref:SDR family oxidoreductase n=1 Tax=Mucilaginibacter pallidiroseus TaxID=2599295 RepID=A0A563TZB3_9SPHI|nr:SDR family oxidoreductase [Mucilaginibacter pallidiroseus]TWR24708.1 SDR family oxidoreductase [Mucilaginibacter pallidiroseus]